MHSTPVQRVSGSHTEDIIYLTKKNQGAVDSIFRGITVAEPNIE